MMTKWDTIQEDVKDQYAYLDEEDVVDEDDVFGFGMEEDVEFDLDEWEEM